MDQPLYIDFSIHNKYNDYTIQPILSIVKSTDKNTIIYGNQSEYKQGWYEDFLNYNSEPNTDHPLIELGHLLSQKNINFYLIVGCSENELFSHFNTIPNFHIIYWPTYLMSRVYENILQYPTHTINTDFKHLFLTYNNKSRHHRCVLMDELCKRELLKDNLYSWIETKSVGHGKERYKQHQFQCFNDQKTLLDNFDYSTHREFTDNIMDMNCLINLVSESDVDSIFTTEKTYRQLMIGQPFLTLGGRNTHNTLKEFGFLLYDEIFDYTFDTLPYYKDRIDGIIDNIQRLKNSNYKEIYNQIKDKVEYNTQLSHKIVLESIHTPNFIMDYTKEYIPNKTIHSIMDSNDMFNILRNKFGIY